MPRTILTKVNGWTPLIDAMAQKYGLAAAAVFGRVWRFCQLENGVCSASMDTIAKDLGLNRMTVMRHIQTLVDNGFLEDKTPDRRYRPHIYAETGRAQIIGEISTMIDEQISATKSSTDGEQDPASATKTSTECNIFEQSVLQKVAVSATKSGLKIDLKRDLKIDLKILDDTPIWEKFFTNIKCQMTNGSASDRLLFRERLASLQWGGRENGVIRLYAESPERAAWLTDRMTRTFENWFNGFEAFAGARVEFVAGE